MKDNGDAVDETVEALLREVILIERRNANELRNVQQERREEIREVIEKLTKAKT